MVGVELVSDCFDEVGCYGLNALVDGCEFDFCGAFDIFLKFLNGDFVVIFKLAIFLPFLLNSVVGEVDQFVIQVFQVVLLAGGSHVTLLVPVSFDAPVDAGDQHIASNIKFPFVVKERTLHILLHDQRSARIAFLAHQRLYLVQRTYHLYTVASVGVLAGLANPNIAFLFTLAFAGKILVELTKPLELRVINSLGDEESDWDDFENVFAKPK